MITYGSVCSGIEAASVAWEPLGWRCAFVSEIEKFPRAVLEHRLGAGSPNGPALHGDFTTIEEDTYGAIDLLVGGTPCQSFSVAGKRLGLDDPRGNLALEYVALARRLRPRWLVWENVPGVLSSDGGRDFGTFLAACAGHADGRYLEPLGGRWGTFGIVEPAPHDGDGPGGYGLAWRVLDAQYVRVDGHPHAVPQRRRRVFVVGYLGDWRRAAAVLFEPEGLRGDPPPRREPGERAAPTLASRTRGGGGLGTDTELDGGLIAAPDVANPLTHRMHKGVNTTMDEGQTMVAHTLLGKPNDSHAADAETYISHTLKGEGFDASEDGTGRGTPIVPVAFDARQSDVCVYGDAAGTVDTMRPAQAVAFAQNQRDEVREMPVAGALPAEPGAKQQTYVAFSSKDHGADASDEVAPTLRAGGHDSSHANAGIPPAIAIQERAICENPDAGPDGAGVRDDGSSYTLEARTVPQAVAFHTSGYGGQVDDVAQPLQASDAKLSNQVAGVIEPDYAVRRLTPTECERLQGFPDGWTQIPWRGKPAAECPDGQRYKALGNSMAVNVMRWIGLRIDMVDRIGR